MRRIKYKQPMRKIYLLVLFCLTSTVSFAELPPIDFDLDLTQALDARELNPREARLNQVIRNTLRQAKISDLDAHRVGKLLAKSFSELHNGEASNEALGWLFKTLKEVGCTDLQALFWIYAEMFPAAVQQRTYVTKNGRQFLLISGIDLQELQERSDEVQNKIYARYGKKSYVFSRVGELIGAIGSLASGLVLIFSRDLTDLRMARFGLPVFAAALIPMASVRYSDHQDSKLLKTQSQIIVERVFARNLALQIQACRKTVHQ